LLAAADYNCAADQLKPSPSFVGWAAGLGQSKTAPNDREDRGVDDGENPKRQWPVDNRVHYARDHGVRIAFVARQLVLPSGEKTNVPCHCLKRH
jgi:hypothetical protein